MIGKTDDLALGPPYFAPRIAAIRLATHSSSTFIPFAW
jgi:hypothetical protein